MYSHKLWLEARVVSFSASVNLSLPPKKKKGMDNPLEPIMIPYSPHSKIFAKNNGPLDFTDAIVSDPLPDGFTEGDFTWTAVTHGGATSKAGGIMVGALQDTVDIPLNESVVYTVNLVVPSSKRDDLINTATITLYLNLSNARFILLIA